MIRINLLGEKVDYTASIFLHSLAYGACMLLLVFGCVSVQMHYREKVTTLEEQKGQMEVRLARLRKQTKEVRELEKNKKFLEEKLLTIAKLKARKHGPVHVLDDLNVSIPERSWLTEVRQRGGALEINGVALDNQTIADFMHQLTESEYFNTVDLVHSRRFVKDDVVLKEFMLFASLVDPLTLKSPRELQRKNGEQEAEQPKTEEA